MVAVCDIPIPGKIKLAVKNDDVQKTIVDVNGVKIGGDRVIIMAGPCSVESREQVLEAAIVVKAGGAQILRGGAFKPRTLPYSFQGLGEEGLILLAEARKETGLPIVTEVMDADKVELVASYTDILQIGTRNMQNFPLLKEVGRSDKPVMLKRGMSATINEWLGCAEYILAEGNPNVIMCERGIRTFETITRNTVDISAAPILHAISHLPVIVDPSHGTGSRFLVPPMSKAAIAAGADGVMVEVHPHPEEALCDGAQSLSPEDFKAFIEDIKPIIAATNRRL
ncbi:3-deoxy-7-phosphoheptulonate synthase [Candidatus Bathyarchaeota archaeon]|jgi:3-deoxy-7-phosphoheptulonate synthase|nr:3-deoxy-7-phosphoheptulonate synthase [Candidatus Bathyarchaeota archaeon]MBT4320830.1 3-deoxy-7-phosphoheptulonate synthase [Candidatus Bathyarchaeota archaeon]MBT4423104.1 3-deoxy-7-phosphoheptulonate synthase [Candidatus Bathyarchaeota archaeon]MBT5642048.1 3-deoxy-7-phosphoheptulonate synthase [Candidatus Bathyarchaeota archaeon]MBT6605480.1 3-deoxy-7-phosphoheptulonate synthase [Candidatus Bathyarchaeota archaeon]